MSRIRSEPRDAELKVRWDRGIRLRHDDDEEDEEEEEKRDPDDGEDEDEEDDSGYSVQPDFLAGGK